MRKQTTKQTKRKVKFNKRDYMKGCNRGLMRGRAERREVGRTSKGNWFTRLFNL